MTGKGTLVCWYAADRCTNIFVQSLRVLYTAAIVLWGTINVRVNPRQLTKWGNDRQLCRGRRVAFPIIFGTFFMTRWLFFWSCLAVPQKEENNVGCAPSLLLHSSLTIKTRCWMSVPDSNLIDEVHESWGMFQGASNSYGHGRKSFWGWPEHRRVLSL